MDTGWIKLHRSIENWDWWDDHNTTRLWIWILIHANHEDKKWRGKIIKSGQFLSSQPKIAEETGLGVQSVRTSLNRLKSTGELTVKITNRYSLIQVNNWHKYQDTNTQVNRQANSQLTGNQQATNNKQELKNNKKERIKEDTSPIIIQLTKNLIAGIANCNSPFKDRYEGDQKKIDDLCNKWSADLDKLIRLDKAKPEDVQAIINWLYQSEGRDALFWRKNILSAAKLREKYLRLVAAAQSDKQQGPRMVIIS